MSVRATHPTAALARIGLLALLILAILAIGAAAASAAPSISIVGNHFVDGAGNTVRLLGVDRESPEYACLDGEIAAGAQPGVNPLTDAEVEAIASWHANAVRVPLNEDCWLGTHGEPGEGLTAAEYRQAIEGYVASLGAHGLYAILDLHWSNPANLGEGEGQHPMPDALSAPFWKSVAGSFAADPGVLFDAYNEPYSPADQGDPAEPVDWSCWLNGGCRVPAAPDTVPPNQVDAYTAHGMQEMVDAIRSTGARQPILLGGLDYANDLSQWLSHEPSDPDGQLAASFHNYPGKPCESESCWNGIIATLAATVPVVTGEFDEFDCPAGTDPNNFDNRWMNWADAHGISYLAWGWNIPEAATCHTDYLIGDYGGTPAESNGVAVHAHLAALASPLTPPPLVPPASPSPAPAGNGGAPSSATPDRAKIAKALAADLRGLGKVPAGGKVAAGKWRPKLAAPGAGTLSLQLLSGTGHHAKPLARGRHRFTAAGSAPVPVAPTGAGRGILASHPNGAATVSLAFDPGPGDPVVKTLAVRLGSQR